MAPITIYIFVLSLEPKITYFLWFPYIEKKNSVCYAYINSMGICNLYINYMGMCNAYINSMGMVGGRGEFCKH